MNINLHITSIEPDYRFESPLGGSFKVSFSGTNVPYWLSYERFTYWLLQKDEKLLSYVKNNFADKSLSHVIQDLYDIGYPVNDGVTEYVEWVKSTVDVDMLNKLITLYEHIANFNTGSRGNHY